MTTEARAPVADRFAERIGCDSLDLRTVVGEVSRIPYGRPSELSADGVVSEWCGTCSTKHMLLAVLATACERPHPVRLWHRPYRLTRSLAIELFAPQVAAAVPADGLVDVHTFATIGIEGRAVQVDVTFPIEDWDGSSDLPLACGDGTDVPAGPAPLETKADLVARYCDPALREPFIAAVARWA